MNEPNILCMNPHSFLLKEGKDFSVGLILQVFENCSNRQIPAWKNQGCQGLLFCLIPIEMGKRIVILIYIIFLYMRMPGAYKLPRVAIFAHVALF